MRFVPPVAALARGPVRFDGDPRLGAGRWPPLLEALRALGVAVDDAGRGHAAVHGARHRRASRAARVTIDASGVQPVRLRAAARGAALRPRASVSAHVGAPMPRAPHIEMTVEMLRERGRRGRADADDCLAGRRPGPSARCDVQVEPDLSNAAPFLAAAVVDRRGVHLPGWPARTDPAGRPAARAARPMGGERHPRPDGPDRDAAPGDAPASTPTCATSASWPRRSPRSPPWPTARRGSPASPTSAATRPTGSPRWRTEINASAATSAETADGLRDPARGRCTAASSTPTTTTGWRPPGRCSGLAVPGVEVEDVGDDRARRCRSSSSLWQRACSAAQADRDQPPRWPARPRRGRRPGPARAARAPARAPRSGPPTRTRSPGWCSPWTGAGTRASCGEPAPTSAGHRDEGPRAGPQGRRRRRPGGLVGDMSGEPDALARIVRVEDARRCCAAAPTTPTRRAGHRRQRRPARRSSPRWPTPSRDRADRPLPGRRLRRRAGAAARASPRPTSPTPRRSSRHTPRSTSRTSSPRARRRRSSGSRTARTTGGPDDGARRPLRRRQVTLVNALVPGHRARDRRGQRGHRARPAHVVVRAWRCAMPGTATAGSSTPPACVPSAWPTSIRTASSGVPRPGRGHGRVPARLQPRRAGVRPGRVGGARRCRARPAPRGSSPCAGLLRSRPGPRDPGAAARKGLTGRPTRRPQSSMSS